MRVLTHSSPSNPSSAPSAAAAAAAAVAFAEENKSLTHNKFEFGYLNYGQCF